MQGVKRRHIYFHGHDEVGNITSVNNATTGEVVTYSYDAVFRLTGAGSS
jgi:YD repeat-containing protein